MEIITVNNNSVMSMIIKAKIKEIVQLAGVLISVKNVIQLMINISFGRNVYTTIGRDGKRQLDTMLMNFVKKNLENKQDLLKEKEPDAKVDILGAYVLSIQSRSYRVY